MKIYFSSQLEWELELKTFAILLLSQTDIFLLLHAASLFSFFARQSILTFHDSQDSQIWWINKKVAMPDNTCLQWICHTKCSQTEPLAASCKPEKVPHMPADFKPTLFSPAFDSPWLLLQQRSKSGWCYNSM